MATPQRGRRPSRAQFVRLMGAMVRTGQLYGDSLSADDVAFLWGSTVGVDEIRGRHAVEFAGRFGPARDASHFWRVWSALCMAVADDDPTVRRVARWAAGGAAGRLRSMAESAEVSRVSGSSAPWRPSEVGGAGLVATVRLGDHAKKGIAYQLGSAWLRAVAEWGRVEEHVRLVETEAAERAAARVRQA